MHCLMLHKQLHEQLHGRVSAYVQLDKCKHALGFEGQVEVQFLAQGEYNLNFLVRTSGRQYVLRINTASQLQLPNQIAYEYQALQLLSGSGVTPRPAYLDDSKQIIPYGLLVMEYLPGEPLDYSCDLLQAASTFARIHSLTFPPERTAFLVQEPGPFSGIYREASTLLQSYFACPDANPRLQKMLETVLLRAEEKRKEEDCLLREPWLAVINTEVNSHNFIVNRKSQTCHLIDWEKPIYGEPAQDLSMFLLATTTMWKRNYILSPQEEELFIREYLAQLPACPHLHTLRDRVQMFKFFNYLRALSWCAMAWTEYTRPGRPLVNMDTFEKIKAYLEEGFIRACFPAVFGKSAGH